MTRSEAQLDTSVVDQDSGQEAYADPASAPSRTDLGAGQPTPVPPVQSPLTALAPVIPGRLPALRAVLAQVERALRSGMPTALDKIGTVHFARWVIVDTGFPSAQLLFTSNFDGSWERYIEDFARMAWKTFDDIYENCEGWPVGGARDVEAFKAYVRAHELDTHAYYTAYPRSTRDEVVRAVQTRAKLGELLELFQ